MFFDLSSTSTQSNISISNDLFKQYILQLASEIIWKNHTLAVSNEDSNNFYLSELFITANRGLLNFDIVKSFPKIVLSNIGVSDEFLDRYAADKYQIPVNIRTAAVNEYSLALTQKNPITGHYAYLDKTSGEYVTVYEERNNYYRMLMGIPNVDDYNYIYNTDTRWDTTTPIHLMTVVDRLEMEQAGVLGKLIESCPSAKYLKHLASKKIDYFKSRTASRFEILYYSHSSSDVLNKIFLEEYLKSTYVINNVYYSKAFVQSNDLYEGFLAMSVLFMTIQNLFYKYLSTDTTRDFFDVESLKLIYDSYKVPFYSEIPLEYHRRIVKNMNKLLSYKGSSNVFFDLFDIFDLASMDIYSYYLTKTHKLDVDGNPIFILKKDDAGNIIYDSKGDPVLDESVFDIAFSRVKIYDDPALSVSNTSNQVKYELITEPDPYWIEDENLQAKLKSEYFNFTESKYLGIQTIFDLMKITFENAYIFRMITDNRKITEELEFKWVDINLDTNVFVLFIYLSSIYCRHYGYDGIITDGIPAIMDTIGYNFEEISSIVKNDIMLDPILNKDTELLNTINLINISNIDSINVSLEKINKLREYIVSKYTSATDKEVFFKYKALYDAIMISKEVTSTYTNKNTGELYHSFTDLLTDISPELMQRYLLLPDNTVSAEMTLIINQLEKLIPKLRYLPYSAGVSSSAMIEALFKILRFFKSAKAELVEYKITYMVTTRGLNFFKMMDKLYYVYNHSWGDDKSQFIDIMQTSQELIELISDYELSYEKIDNLQFRIRLDNEILIYKDMVRRISEYIHYKFRDSMWYIDILNSLKEIVKIRSVLSISDVKEMELLGFKLHAQRYSETIKELTSVLVDTFKENGSAIHLQSLLYLYDKMHRMVLSINSKTNEMSDSFCTVDKIYNILNVRYYDNLDICNDYAHALRQIFNLNDEDMTLKDMLSKIQYTLFADDNIYFSDNEINIKNIAQPILDLVIFYENFKIGTSEVYYKDNFTWIYDVIRYVQYTFNYYFENSAINDILYSSNISQNHIGSNASYRDSLQYYQNGNLVPVI